MTKDEVLKLAQEVCPYFDERLKGAFYEGFITALDHIPDTTKMIDTGTDRGAWSDVPDATRWVDELRGDEDLDAPPNSTTDVVESTDSLSTLLWRDLKTDRQRADWLRLGMGYQTGVVAAAIQQELAMAYERLVGFQKIHAAPPKRKWVGLTDEEIEVLYGQAEHHHGEFNYRFDNNSFAKAIEAKLKEKNT